MANAPEKPKRLAGKDFVQRFRTEASAAAVLQHPNIVAIHNGGVQEGRQYFSMDHVEGQILAQIVGQQPLAPVKSAITPDGLPFLTGDTFAPEKNKVIRFSLVSRSRLTI